MAAFLLQRTAHAPTGVSHCISARVINLHEENLVVVQSNELHVYAIGQQVSIEICVSVFLDSRRRRARSLCQSSSYELPSTCTG